MYQLPKYQNEIQVTTKGDARLMVLITETVGLVSTGRQKRKKNSPFTLPQMNEHFGYSRNEYRYGGGAQWTSSGWAAGKTSLQIQAHIIATFTRDVCATSCLIDVNGQQVTVTRTLYDAFKTSRIRHISEDSSEINDLVLVILQIPGINRENAQQYIDAMMARLLIPERLREAIELGVLNTLNARERQAVMDNIWDDPAWHALYHDPMAPFDGWTARDVLLLFGLAATPFAIGKLVTLFPSLSAVGAGGAAVGGAGVVHEVGRIITKSNGQKIQLVTNTTAVSYTGNIGAANVQHFTLINGQWMPVVLSNVEIVQQLSRSQSGHVETINNVINNNLTERDFSAVLSELQGNPILRPNGTPWDHVTEMRQSLTALTRAVDGLQGSLQNPNLDLGVRNFIQSEVNIANSFINRINELFQLLGR